MCSGVEPTQAPDGPSTSLVTGQERAGSMNLRGTHCCVWYLWICFLAAVLVRFLICSLFLSLCVPAANPQVTRATWSALSHSSKWLDATCAAGRASAPVRRSLLKLLTALVVLRDDLKYLKATHLPWHMHRSLQHCLTGEHQTRPVSMASTKSECDVFHGKAWFATACGRRRRPSTWFFWREGKASPFLWLALLQVSWTSITYNQWSSTGWATRPGHTERPSVKRSAHATSGHSQHRPSRVRSCLRPSAFGAGLSRWSVLPCFALFHLASRCILEDAMAMKIQWRGCPVVKQPRLHLYHGRMENLHFRRHRP